MLTKLRLLPFAAALPFATLGVNSVAAQISDFGTGKLEGASLPPRLADAAEGEPYECIDDASPRPYRKEADGRYKFNMKYENSHCVDGDDNRYQYGKIDGVGSFSSCAEKCVQKESTELLAELVGFEWKCTGNSKSRDECLCLYNKGALGDQDVEEINKVFSLTDEDYEGEGSIEGGEDGKKYFYCAKLVQAEEDDVQSEVRVSRRGLRA